MIESDEDSPATGGQDGELLLYDFFKHLTSLSILVLGGVLVLAQSADRADVKPLLLIIVLVLISGSGVLAFSGSSEIARSRSTGTPAKTSVQWSRKIAPALLALGAGMLLSMFVGSLA